MAETDRAEAQRRRADARRQRRTDEDGAEQAEDSEDSGAGDAGAEDDSHAGLKHAAKVAAAGAAIGAAVGAALSGRDAPSEDGDDEPRSDDATERDDEDTPEAAVRQEEPVQQEQDEEDKPPTDEVERTLDDAAGDEPNAPQEARAGDRDSGAPQKGASPDETVEVAGRARQQLQALHGREPESVSSLARTAEGWTVTVEVVELQRVPDSTDEIASYELLLDEDKNLIRYERRRRYYRSQADRGGD